MWCFDVRRFPIVAAVLLTASSALAQNAPTPTLSKSPPTWLGYIIIMMMLALVIAVSLMPSKRSHQD